MSREPGDADAIRRFMSELGRRSPIDATAYLVGGTTAVLRGWRPTTVDVDLRIEPDRDEILRLLRALKEELGVNVELAAPDDFLPELPGWRERSPYLGRHGRVTFRDYDPYAQLLAKIERWHVRDRDDVEAFLASGLVRRGRALELFTEIEPRLFRFPAVDPAAFRSRVEQVLGRGDDSD